MMRVGRKIPPARFLAIISAGSNLERAAAVFGRSEFGLPPTDVRF